MPGRPPEVSAERPLRVVVAGSSVAYFVRPPRQDRTEGADGEVLVERLAASGIPARVDIEARWLDEIHLAYHHVEERVYAKSPDVVVVDFGWLECQPRVLPTAVYRYLTTYRPRLNPRTFPVHRWTARRISPLYKWLTPKVDARWDGLPSRMPPGRFEAELRRYIEDVSREMGSLILVSNVNPTTQRIVDHMPSVQERAARYSEMIERIVADAGDHVRLIDTRALVSEHGCEAILPDGIHYNAEGHRLVAELLATAIERWLASA